MSNYDDRLAALRDQARETEATMQNLAESEWPAKAVRDRTLGVLAYAQTVLETTDPTLVSDAAFQQVSSALTQFQNNPSVGTTNADPWISVVIDAISQLPAARGREVEQAVKDAAANFQRSAQQRLNALKSEYHAGKAELDALKSEIEQRRTELTAEITEGRAEVSTEITALQSAFEQRLAQYEQQLQSEQSALSKLRTTQTAEFEELEEKRAMASKERVEEAQQAIAALQQRALAEVEERVAEIRRMESESAQLVGAIGLAGTAERYGEEVEQQKGIADTWRIATVVLALLAVISVIVAVAEKHPVAETFSGKLALSAIFGGIATYAARQSRYHRDREQRARDLQLELTAFSPFIEPLSPEQREEERVIMTRKTFGKTTTSVKQEEEPGPTPLSFLLRRREKEADAQSA
jgi:hypothetical protein